MERAPFTSHGGLAFPAGWPRPKGLEGSGRPRRVTIRSQKTHLPHKAPLKETLSFTISVTVAMGIGCLICSTSVKWNISYKHHLEWNFHSGAALDAIHRGSSVYKRRDTPPQPLLCSSLYPPRAAPRHLSLPSSPTQLLRQPTDFFESSLIKISI